MNEQAPQIPGFNIEKVIGNGATSTVYRAIRDTKPYAIKIIKLSKSANPQEELLRFLREAATIAKLSHPGLVKLHEVAETNGRPYLVMELIEGESLLDRIARGPLSESELLKLSSSLATILDYFHCRGVIHKDLKPENILFNERGEVKIIDFGFATDMAEAKSALQNEPQGEVQDEIVGTLLYAAPEQTGMLRRPIDSRSDLYALGGLLYHAATARPAFEAKTAIALMTLHLTGKAAAPSKFNSSLRPVFEAIILKLLAKDPDDRYQSAKGLHADLLNINEIELGGASFLLGARDSGLRTVEMPLVGRTLERNQILEAREGALSGHGSVLLIAGEGGSGKTRLVREILSVKNDSGLFVLSGKCKQGETIPFGPLREAIDDLLMRAQRSSSTERDRVVNGLRQAAGDLAGIVRRLSPGLQKILSEAKEIPPLDGNAEQERFYLNVSEFFLALPKYFGPVILLIDDIQWLDDGSLEIFRQFCKQLATTPILLAATSRNETSNHAALTHFVDAVKGARVTQINLSPLDLHAIDELIAAHLGGKRLETSSLESIAAKSSGNPFAIGEYIRALLDRGMLKPTEDKWVFDKQHFHELALPDDVIQLLINRVATLTPSAAKALSIAAVIGYEFEVEFLSSALEGHRDSFTQAIAEGLQSALIEKTERGYAFVHDRVSEALVKSMSETELREAHQKLAETLERIRDHSPQQLYALARHYYLGFPERNPEKVFTASLAAGTNALENFSNEEALELLGRALHFARAIDIGGEDLSRIHESIGLASTRTGRQQQAIENFKTALEAVTSTFDRARLRYLLGLAHASEGQHERAKKEMFKALQLLDTPFPRTVIGSIVSLVGNWIAAEFRYRSKIGYGSATGAEKKRRQLMSKIHVAMNLLAYLMGDQLIMIQSILRELRNVQFLGTCVETAKAHVYYGVLLSFLTLKKNTEKHGQLAIAMAKQLGDKEALTFCELDFAIAVEFAGDNLRSYDLVLAVYPKVVRYSAAWERSVAIGHRTHIIVAGKVRENIAWVEKTMPVLLQTGDLSLLHAVYSGLFACHSMIGQTSEAVRARQLQKSLPEKVWNEKLSRTIYYSNTIHGFLCQEDFGPDIERAITEMDEVKIETYHNRYRFAIAGFARVEQVRRCKSKAERRRLMKSLAYYVRKSGYPIALTPLHLSLHHTLKGAYRSLKGRYFLAERSFKKAGYLAVASDNQWMLWMVARERARIAHTVGDEPRKQSEALRALSISTENGWLALSQQITRDFAVHLSKPANSENSDSHSNSGFSRSSAKRGNFGRLLTAERNAEVLLQVNLASTSTLDPQKQAQAILDELISVLGAERAFLFEADLKDSLKLRAGRDAEKSDILELKGYSSTVVKTVGTNLQPLVVSGTDEGEILGAQSIVAHNLRSILAVPVMFREKFLGVLYLDSTLAKGIFTESDVEIVLALANHIGIALEGARSANIEIENRTMKKDLEVTSAVQSLILPKKNVFSSEELKMASFYKAASQSGGDWWWYDYSQESGQFSMLMGDVTGHGAGAAMISAAVSGIYQAFRSMRTSSQRLPDFLKLLNTTLLDLAAEKYMLAMNAVEINLRTGQIDYWSAGAPPLLIIRHTGECVYLAEAGSWLGSSEFGLGHQTYQLEPGDRVAVFTDGLFEIEMAGKKQLGFRRLEKLLKQTRTEPVEKATNSVISKVIALQVPSDHEDDISFVLIDYLGSPSPAASSKSSSQAAG